VEAEELNGAGLLVVLEGDRECFAGAVRCYVDGRFVGQVGEGGTMQTAITPGEHYIEIWDSRGRWEAEVNALPGQAIRIPIRCEGRTGEGIF
jgi:hypothetical protein